MGGQEISEATRKLPSSSLERKSPGSNINREPDAVRQERIWTERVEREMRAQWEHAKDWAPLYHHEPLKSSVEKKKDQKAKQGLHACPFDVHSALNPANPSMVHLSARLNQHMDVRTHRLQSVYRSAFTEQVFPPSSNERIRQRSAQGSLTRKEEVGGGTAPPAAASPSHLLGRGRRQVTLALGGVPEVSDHHRRSKQQGVRKLGHSVVEKERVQHHGCEGLHCSRSAAPDPRQPSVASSQVLGRMRVISPHRDMCSDSNGTPMMPFGGPACVTRPGPPDGLATDASSDSGANARNNNNNLMAFSSMHAPRRSVVKSFTPVKRTGSASSMVLPNHYAALPNKRDVARIVKMAREGHVVDLGEHTAGRGGSEAVPRLTPLTSSSEYGWGWEGTPPLERFGNVRNRE